MEHLEIIPTLAETERVNKKRPYSFARWRKPNFKRVFDILFSLSVTMLLLPLFLLIALSIKLTSKGKIIYSQERIGRDGIPFPCYKFRTMHENADDLLERILSKNPKLKEEWLVRRKLSNDPRITPVGHFLRRFSLDELPQFFNVLKGDLSVVGPRPVSREEILQYFGPHAQEILKVRPGITGLWQILNRPDMTYQERVEIEKKYVSEQRNLKDLKLIAKTVPVLLGAKPQS